MLCRQFASTDLTRTPHYSRRLFPLVENAFFQIEWIQLHLPGKEIPGQDPSHPDENPLPLNRPLERSSRPLSDRRSQGLPPEWWPCWSYVPEPHLLRRTSGCHPSRRQWSRNRFSSPIRLQDYSWCPDLGQGFDQLKDPLMQGGAHQQSSGMSPHSRS